MMINMGDYIEGGVDYDWCFPCQQRTPSKYPYSFDAHFIWKDSDIEGCDVVYSDRLWEWDRDKASRAFSTVQKGKRAIRLNKQQCNEIIKNYYDGEYECDAYGLCCNQSNGYEIGIFWIREKAKI